MWLCLSRLSFNNNICKCRFESKLLPSYMVNIINFGCLSVRGQGIPDSSRNESKLLDYSPCRATQTSSRCISDQITGRIWVASHTFDLTQIGISPRTWPLCTSPVTNGSPCMVACTNSFGKLGVIKITHPLVDERQLANSISKLSLCIIHPGMNKIYLVAIKKK